MGAEEVLPRHAFFVLLALASGATDAFGFLHLGGTFTSVMTGNMVLFGLAAAHADVGLVVRAGAAICGYLAGASLAVRLAGATYTRSPARTVSRLLRIEFCAFVIYAIVFQVAPASVGLGVQTAMLVLAALGLGMQSSAVHSYGVSGLSTTFLTGTLTAVAIHLAQGHPLRDSRRSLLILVGLIAGAAAATGLALESPRAAAWLPAAFVACALSLTRRNAPVLAEVRVASGRVSG